MTQKYSDSADQSPKVGPAEVVSANTALGQASASDTRISGQFAVRDFISGASPVSTVDKEGAISQQPSSSSSLTSRQASSHTEGKKLPSHLEARKPPLPQPEARKHPRHEAKKSPSMQDANKFKTEGTSDRATSSPQSSLLTNRGSVRATTTKGVPSRAGTGVEPRVSRRKGGTPSPEPRRPTTAQTTTALHSSPPPAATGKKEVQKAKQRPPTQHGRSPASPRHTRTRRKKPTPKPEVIEGMEFYHTNIPKVAANELFSELSSKITKWAILGRYLGMTDIQLEEVKRSTTKVKLPTAKGTTEVKRLTTDCRECCDQMLHLWSARTDGTVTFAHLARALVSSMHTNLLLDLYTAMQDSSSSQFEVVSDTGPKMEIALPLDDDFENNWEKVKQLLKQRSSRYRSAILNVNLT